MEPTEDSTFGKRLREIRKRRGLTQRELAEKLGTQQSMIAQYEGGYIRVNAAGLIARLARALEASPNELLGFEEIKAERVVRSRGLLRRIKKVDQLPAADQKALVRFLDALLTRQQAQASTARREPARPRRNRRSTKAARRSRVA